MDVNGKVAFITGGASGIGFGIARVLVANGAKVVLADMRQDHLDHASGYFAERQEARNVHAIRLDVTDRAAMAAAADEAEARFGGTDILVSNAGVGLEGPLDQATYADWDFGLGVNLGGVVNGIQTFVPRMRARGTGGHVVNTASLAGMVVMPSFMAIYATGKAAVIALSESIRDGLAADGIGVSVLWLLTSSGALHYAPAAVAANVIAVCWNFALTDANGLPLYRPMARFLSIVPVKDPATGLTRLSATTPRTWSCAA